MCWPDTGGPTSVRAVLITAALYSPEDGAERTLMAFLSLDQKEVVSTSF